MTTRRLIGPLVLASVALASALIVRAPALAQTAQAESTAPRFAWDPNDPRVGLGSGWMDAESAIWNMHHVSSLAKPEGFFNPETPGDRNFNNTDLAFRGDLLFQGNYNGFQVYEISDPTNPELRLSVVCPGGQGDVSVYGDLVFMSAQETRGRLDCGFEGVADSVSTERLRGIRIFDLSDVSNPKQVAAIQTCRGSHTHTVVTDPNDPDNVYVYNSGTSSVRPGSEMPGCSGGDPNEDPNTAYFRIEVIKVPLASPEQAEIVNMPRLFADAETGAIAGLWQGGDHGEGTQSTRLTHQCHDITAYPGIGLAAGACSGNGILIDIRDPANPVRLDEVLDPNFAYWHSATFNNDGSKILFTDEWGGGSAPRCRASDPPTWGANAIFTRDGESLGLAGYYKLPVPQTVTENCVAHNGSMVPVPGRDIMVQAWYQGGISVLDFTDPANPIEIAYFDRGPLSDTELFTGGYWSAYWYNGRIYGAEISRGIDVFDLTVSEHLSEAELEAAKAVQVNEFNAQLQPRFEWAATPSVAQAYLDQMVRGGGILTSRADEVRRVLEGTSSASQLGTVAASLDADAAAVQAGTLGGDAERLSKLAEVLRELGG
ncbi:MAG: LVIVD repeat-containing protein [Longimicrobiales bacterium]